MNAIRITYGNADLRSMQIFVAFGERFISVNGAATLATIGYCNGVPGSPA